MTEHGGAILDEAIESWAFARRGVIAEAEGIPDDMYDYRPHANARSVAEILRHLVESGLMMVGELTKPEGDFTRQDFPAFIREHAGELPSDATPGELRALLASTLEEGAARFRNAGDAFMLTDIRRFDGDVWARVTWMHHGIAHEEYHRGQLATYARMLGLVPALTKLIHGEDAG